MMARCGKSARMASTIARSLTALIRFFFVADRVTRSVGGGAPPPGAATDGSPTGSSSASSTSEPENREWKSSSSSGKSSDSVVGRLPLELEECELGGRGGRVGGGPAAPNKSPGESCGTGTLGLMLAALSVAKRLRFLLGRSTL